MGVHGLESHHPPTINFCDFPHVELEKTHPDIPRNGIAWILVRPPYLRQTCSPAGSGGESIVRFSFGRLLVSLLPVVKRTMMRSNSSTQLRAPSTEQSTTDHLSCHHPLPRPPISPRSSPIRCCKYHRCYCCCRCRCRCRRCCCCCCCCCCCYCYCCCC